MGLGGSVFTTVPKPFEQHLYICAVHAPKQTMNLTSIIMLIDNVSCWLHIIIMMSVCPNIAGTL